jgi:hypothetical protein
MKRRAWIFAMCAVVIAATAPLHAQPDVGLSSSATTGACGQPCQTVFTCPVNCFICDHDQLHVGSCA